MQLHKVLTPENKKKIEKIMTRGPDGLSQVSKFADEHFGEKAKKAAADAKAAKPK